MFPQSPWSSTRTLDSVYEATLFRDPMTISPGLGFFSERRDTNEIMIMPLSYLEEFSRLGFGDMEVPGINRPESQRGGYYAEKFAQGSLETVIAYLAAHAENKMPESRQRTTRKL